MGARGPKPSPPELENMRADNRPSRQREGAAPAPVHGWPPVPECVAREELRQAHWSYVCQSLDGMGILAECDEGIITAYVLARSTLETVTSILDAQVSEMGREKAYGADSAAGPVRNHLLTEQRAARGDVAKFAAMLGLTPTARSNIRTPEPPSVGGSRFFA